MEKALSAGKQLLQEEWAHADEKRWVDELVAEGKAKVTRWSYHAGFQALARYITSTGEVR